MSLLQQEVPELGEKTNSKSAKLALEALNTPRNQAKPFNPLAPPSRPALPSDPKPEASDPTHDSSGTISSVSTSIFSFFYGTSSGTASAATSRSNSVNLDTIKQDRISANPTTSRWSVWSALPNDLSGQGSNEKLYPSTNHGVVFALVRESIKVGMYRGYVDICQKKVLRDNKWDEKIWSIVDSPEVVVEQSEEARGNGNSTQIHAAPAAVDADKILPATPASTRQSMDELPLLDPPISTPSSPGKRSVHSSTALSLATHLECNASQISLSSTTDSFHTAVSRSREHSVTSTLSAQHLTQQSTQSPSGMTLPFGSIASRIESESAHSQNALQGNIVQEHSAVADGHENLDKRLYTEAISKEGGTNSAFDQFWAATTSGTTRDEHCLRDVRILHPHPASMEAVTTVAKLDPGSDHSFISPRILDSLKIPLDSDLIEPSSYEYSTLGGLVIARGRISLKWRIFNRQVGHPEHETTTFYIAPDNMPCGLLLGNDYLIPFVGQPRVSFCLMNITIPNTAEQDEEKRKRKEEAEKEAEENARLKKEVRAAAASAAARQAATPSSELQSKALGRRE